MRRWLIGACALAALLALGGGACGGDDDKKTDEAPAPRCKPGGDGTYTKELYGTLDEYCMVHIEGGRVVPEQGVVPYDLNGPLFSDYADKFRTVWLPPGTQATYSDEHIEFPVGTIFTKSFGFADDARQADAPVRWIETRVLVRGDDGWLAVSYLWDDEHKVAIKKAGGKILDLHFTDAQGAEHSPTYLVPNGNQCKKCHSDDGALTPVGPRPAQLNREHDYADGRANQLDRWTKLGWLAGAPSPDQAPRLLRWDDPAEGPVEARARAYLEANCGYCHNPRGDARTSGLLLSASVSEPYKFGVCKSPVAAGKAASDMFYDVVPGKPDSSILIYRMESTEPSIMMPEIGRSLPHQEAAALVRQWISEMPGDCSQLP